MKIRLVFDEWRHMAGFGLAGTEKGVELSAGDFHSGSTFEATIEVDADTAEELEQAMSFGYRPMFYAIRSKE